jgi:hypothetical protein
MMAILVAPEFWWLESASSSDLKIHGNIIDGCKRTPISIQAHGGNRKVLPAGAHRNISIRGNKITDSAFPNLHVTSTDGLVIKDNQFMPIPVGSEEQSIKIENCTNIVR